MARKFFGHLLVAVTNDPVQTVQINPVIPYSSQARFTKQPVLQALYKDLTFFLPRCVAECVTLNGSKFKARSSHWIAVVEERQARGDLSTRNAEGAST